MKQILLNIGGTVLFVIILIAEYKDLLEAYNQEIKEGIVNKDVSLYEWFMLDFKNGMIA